MSGAFWLVQVFLILAFCTEKIEKKIFISKIFMLIVVNAIVIGLYYWCLWGSTGPVLVYMIGWLPILVYIYFFISALRFGLMMRR